jgi:hypothetical protein
MHCRQETVRISRRRVFGSCVPSAEPSLVDKILTLHTSFAEAGIDHAFGGALALAFYTREPRATADIDLNIFLDSTAVERVFDALPSPVSCGQEDAEKVRNDDQVRLWWGRTPIDFFFRASPFHDGVAARSVRHSFASAELPFLSADDLAVFKALFDRPKDWIDIEAMIDAGALDLPGVADTLRSLLGDDRRVDRMSSLTRR